MIGSGHRARVLLLARIMGCCVSTANGQKSDDGLKNSTSVVIPELEAIKSRTFSTPEEPVRKGSRSVSRRRSRRDSFSVASQDIHLLTMSIGAFKTPSEFASGKNQINAIPQSGKQKSRFHIRRVDEVVVTDKELYKETPLGT